MTRTDAHGFTVLELMATVAVLAVLTVVALPTFKQYQGEGRRTEAHVGLGTIVRLQDHFFEKNGRYARTIDELDFTMDRGAAQGTNTWNGYEYAFSITPLNDAASQYMASATGNLDGDQFQDILVVVR